MVYIARWQVILILAICVLGIAFSAPNFIPEKMANDIPDWLPHKQVSLGLDLRGGSYLLLEAKIDVVLKEHIEALRSDVRRVLRSAKPRIGFIGLAVTRKGVTFKLRNLADRARAEKRLKDLIQRSYFTQSTSRILGGGGGGPDFDLAIADDGVVTMTLTKQAIIAKRKSALEQSIEVVRRRIDELGTREPIVQRQGENRIIVQVPGVKNPARLKKIIGETAKMTFHFVDANADPNNPPAGTEVLVDDENPTRRYVVRKRVIVSGESLVDAQPTFDRGQAVVSFRFNSVGARKFGEATQANVGRIFAIVLDDKVISAPVIRSPILGGSGIITGGFTVQSATDLAVLLRAGALPAPLTVLEERTVGPGLGQDSIDAGKVASFIGIVLVVGFMIMAYGFFGVLADLALAINLILIVAALSLLQATLTLPGIAGIVLTIGMAVDANVLIFERIREEVRAGRTPISAVDTGYRRALTTIVDSNLTTLIAALLLFEFGAGPIKGFAVTLSIGILTSMFSAVMVTRLMVVAWLRRRRPQVLPI